MVLNLPAVILAAFLDIGVGLLHVHTNESTILAFTVVFAPLIWYRVGKWLDDQSMNQSPNPSTWFRAKSAWKIIVRVIFWVLFGLLLLGFLVEHRRESFMSLVVTFWLGAYLAGGLVGDYWRKGARRREAVV